MTSGISTNLLLRWKLAAIRLVCLLVFFFPTSAKGGDQLHVLNNYPIANTYDPSVDLLSRQSGYILVVNRYDLSRIPGKAPQVWLGDQHQSGAAQPAEIGLLWYELDQNFDVERIYILPFAGVINEISDFEVSPEGLVYILGRFSGHYQLDFGAMTTLEETGQDGVFLIAFDPTDGQGWSCVWSPNDQHLKDSLPQILDFYVDAQMSASSNGAWVVGLFSSDFSFEDADNQSHPLVTPEKSGGWYALHVSPTGYFLGSVVLPFAAATHQAMHRNPIIGTGPDGSLLWSGLLDSDVDLAPGPEERTRGPREVRASDGAYFARYSSAGILEDVVTDLGGYPRGFEVLRDGSLLAYGDSFSILNAPAHAFIQRLKAGEVGQPAAMISVDWHSWGDQTMFRSMPDGTVAISGFASQDPDGGGVFGRWLTKPANPEQGESIAMPSLPCDPAQYIALFDAAGNALQLAYLCGSDYPIQVVPSPDGSALMVMMVRKVSVSEHLGKPGAEAPHFSQSSELLVTLCEYAVERTVHRE